MIRFFCLIILLVTTTLSFTTVSSLFAASPHHGLIVDYPLWEPPANAIHIDPENDEDNNRDGSIEHPFISFRDKGFPWSEGNVYALKRGTTLTGPYVEIASPGVTIASYGSSSQRPIYKSTATSSEHAFFTWDAARSDITIRDIEIEAGNAKSCIRIINANNSDMIRIINCKLRGGTWGLRVLYTSHVLVENVEVYDTADDGMFIQKVDYLEIKNCYVHHVNTNWQPPHTDEEDASGDGIQLSSCNHWHVHHNYIDRTSSGNKFCFISNNPDQDDGILEHNYMTGPLVDGTTVYIGDGDNMIIRHNYMIGPADSPFCSHGTNIQYYGNIMANIDGKIITSQSASFTNNVFYNMGIALYGGQNGIIESNNNIFIMKNNGSPYDTIAHLTASNNLTLADADPLFVNPEENDFRLRPESPAIGTGLAINPREDINGTPIPMDNNTDIGAMEYQSVPARTP